MSGWQSKDFAPCSTRRYPGKKRCAGAYAAAEGSEHRDYRYRSNKSLPVQGNYHETGRDSGRCHREHRHRRTYHAPFGSKEPQGRCSSMRSCGLCHRRRRTPCKRRGFIQDKVQAGAESVRAYSSLRCHDLTVSARTDRCTAA